MNDKLQQAWATALGPLAERPLLQAAAILAASVLLALVADRLVVRVLKAWTKRTRGELDDRLLSLLHRPIFVSVLFGGIWLALLRLDVDERYQALGGRLILTLLLLIWLVFAIRATAAVLASLARLDDRMSFIEPRTVALLDNALNVVFVGVGIYLFCVIWGIPVAGWLATGGVIGLVLGLAAKDTLGNLFAGMFILADAPYQVGDFITLDTGERGRVTDVGLRTTRLLTRDDIEVTVPNSVMANAKIVNESGGNSVKERVRVQVGVAYGSDIDRVREVLMQIAHQEPLLADDPEPRVRFRGLGDSSLDLELLGWIDEPVLRGRALDSLYTAVYKRLRSEGIEIPYPKRDVYLHQVPAAAGKDG